VILENSEESRVETTIPFINVSLDKSATRGAKYTHKETAFNSSRNTLKN